MKVLTRVLSKTVLGCGRQQGFSSKIKCNVFMCATSSPAYTLMTQVSVSSRISAKILFAKKQKILFHFKGNKTLFHVMSNFKAFRV